MTVITTSSAFDILLTGSYLTAGTITAYLESIIDQKARYDAVASGTVSLHFSEVPAGKYLLFANVDGLGYAFFNSLDD